MDKHGLGDIDPLGLEAAVLEEPSRAARAAAKIEGAATGQVSPEQHRKIAEGEVVRPGVLEGGIGLGLGRIGVDVVNSVGIPLLIAG